MMQRRDENEAAESPKTQFLDVTKLLADVVRQAQEEQARHREDIKKIVLGLIRENDELRRLNLESLESSLRTVELRVRTEEVVRSEFLRLGYEGIPDRELLIKEILDEALALGPLEDLLNDETVDEIMVNRPDRIFVERRGKVELTDRKFVSVQQVYNVIERIVGPIGRRVDESSPYVDARLLRDGSRVHIIVPPLALNGPTITIRIFSRKPFSADKLIQKGSLSRNAYRFLDVCVKAKKSVLVSGGTGSGKTTLLNILSSSIPEDERIITIEDAAELRLTHLNLVSLESRRHNVEGKGEVTIRELVRNALRMRPDRIIVGECRGPEAFDMLQAMNTGHEGSLTTIHANSPEDMLSRLENLVLMAVEIPLPVIRRNISSAVNLIVQISRYRDGTRKISEISEVTGMDADGIKLQKIFEFVETGTDDNGRVMGQFRATGYKPAFLEEFRIKNFNVEDSWFENNGSSGDEEALQPDGGGDDGDDAHRVTSPSDFGPATTNVRVTRDDSVTETIGLVITKE